MKRKPFTLRIIHKGLALVFIPLVVNTIWLAYLNNCLERTEKIVEAEREQSILLQHINNCILYFAEAIGGMSNYLTMGDPRYQREGQANMRWLKVEIAALKEMGRTNPDIRYFTNHTLEDAADAQFKALETLEAPSGEQSLAQMFVKFKQLTRFLSSVGAKNKTLQADMRQKQLELDQIRAREIESRHNTRNIIIAGLVSNFLVALALASLFVRDITKRLSVLIDNSKRLPKRLSLGERVRGHDELSELDQALHEAAVELASAHEYRRSLMQMMAHDLRSPLSSCVVSLDLLERKNRETLSAGSSNQIQAINSSIERLLALINDLLTIESLELNQMPLDVAPENVNELCQSAMQSVIGLAEAKDLTVSNFSKIEYIVVDRERVLQVLVNFLSNAIKFSPGGGIIEISTQKIDGELRITVSDQGQGLTEQECQSLFRKFHQLKAGKKAGGSGLGLAISKLIAESHGGHVGVQSASGQGSSFWLGLPMASADSA